MKQVLIFIALLISAGIGHSQNIGIGTNTPNASALLDISSTSKGLLIPRMTNTQMNAITSPAPGLLVFNLTDSLLYVRKNSGWTKLVPTASSGSNWISNGNDIYNSNNGNVGIGSTSPVHARMEITSSVGNAVAMFGADKTGVTIMADNPGIGFNYYYNGGSKTIKSGYAALLEMNPSDGSLYIGNFNGNQSATDFGSINGYKTALTILQNGKIRVGDVPGYDTATLSIQNKYFNGISVSLYTNNGIDYGSISDYYGSLAVSSHYAPSFIAPKHLLLNPPSTDVQSSTGNVGINNTSPTHAKLEISGKIGATVAMFGADRFGTTVNADNPGIGFNYYFDGTNAKTIKPGFAGLMEMNRFNGDIYIGNFNNTVSQFEFGEITNYQNALLIKQNGHVGIGTSNPTERLHVGNGNLQVDNDIKTNGGIYAAETGGLNIVPLGIITYFYQVNDENQQVEAVSINNMAGSLATGQYTPYSFIGNDDETSLSIELDFNKVSSYSNIVAIGGPEVSNLLNYVSVLRSEIIRTNSSCHLKVIYHVDGFNSFFATGKFIIYGIR